MSKFLFFFLFFLSTIPYTLNPVYAVVDPLSVPNNKFGIHIIQATPDESSPAASLVNSSGGDWGYITVLIESKDRNKNKWQEFFNDLRRRHLIPLVRIATKPVNAYWERPYEGEEEAWADFLDSLNWPTKNRYVIIYNEPNHGQEWGNFVDPKLYARVLDKTITALKNKNGDFFVLNAGFDASAPFQPPQFMDEITFMQQMEQAVPGIFNKLDGWVSHSYPNPGFVGSPDGIGRGTVRTWYWEIQQLRNLGVSKNFNIFITETGWKHAEGINYNPSLPDSETVAGYYKNAFEGAWASSQIVAVTPFLLSYQEQPFDHFSFKQFKSSDFYPQFQTVLNVPKVSGKPIQENRAQLIQGEIFSSVVSGETYDITLTFKNTGQSIWDEAVRIVPMEGGSGLGIETIQIPRGVKVEPQQEYSFNIKLKAPSKGSFKVALNLFVGQKQFDNPPFEFTTEVKSPVILQVKNLLKWKKNPVGEYLLRVEGAVGESIQKVKINSEGKSDEMEARYLLPDYTFNFTLERPFYKSSQISQKLKAGPNLLDFGTMNPDIFSAVFHPKELWRLLPFSKRYIL